MSTVIIINPISGGVSPRAARARAQLALAVVDAHGDPAEVLMTEAVGHARELARSAVRRGARLVMAWGGDGTISEVASALAFDEVPLPVSPAGLTMEESGGSSGSAIFGLEIRDRAGI